MSHIRQQIELSHGKSEIDVLDFWKDKAVEIAVQELPAWIAESFVNSAYRTMKTTSLVKLYRVFGGTAQTEGSFLTTEAPSDVSIAEKILALKRDWGNTKVSYAEIHVPPDTVLFVGTAAPQLANDQLPDIPFCRLPGGAMQVVLQQDFYEKNPDAVHQIKKTPRIIQPLGRAALTMFESGNGGEKLNQVVADTLAELREELKRNED